MRILGIKKQYKSTTLNAHIRTFMCVFIINIQTYMAFIAKVEPM